MDLLLLMKFGVVLASFYAVITQFYQACLMTRRRKSSAWVHYALAGVCLYWMAYYLRSIIGIELGVGHQVFVRAPLMLTIALIGAAGAYAVRRYK